MGTLRSLLREDNRVVLRVEDFVVLVLVLPLWVLRVFEAFLVDPRSVLDLVLFIVALPRPDLEDSIRGFRDCQMKSGRASVPRRGPPLNAP